MAKETKPDVSEEGDYARRFEALEKNAAESNTVLGKIAKHLKIDAEPEPDPKKKKKTDESSSKPVQGIRVILEGIGILAPEDKE